MQGAASINQGLLAFEPIFRTLIYYQPISSANRTAIDTNGCEAAHKRYKRIRSPCANSPSHSSSSVDRRPHGGEGGFEPRDPSAAALLKTQRVRPFLRSFSDTAGGEFVRPRFDVSKPIRVPSKSPRAGFPCIAVEN
jgi:hypothetical protein